MKSILHLYLMYLPIIILTGCSREKTEDKHQEEPCICILDELVEKRISISSDEVNSEKSFGGEVNPSVSAELKKIADLDIALRLYLNEKEDESRSNTNINEISTEFDDDFLQKYFNEREIFCAKYRAYCKDASIADSVKTVFFLDELEKLQGFLRKEKEETDSHANIIPEQRTSSTLNTNTGSIDQKNKYGDNISQGENSIVDKRTQYFQEQLKIRVIDEPLKEELSILFEKCAGTEIDILLLNEEYESRNLARQIAELFKKSGIVNHGIFHSMLAEPSDYRGCGVDMPSVFDTCEINIAYAIVSKMPFGVDFWKNSERRNPTVIIGTNPENYID